MSFRGELREFELPDILQLIASQKKAGWLKVIWKGNCQFVFFADGKITSTKNPADEVDPFETFLLRRGFLNEDQSDRVAAARRKTGMDIQDVVQKEGFFTRDEIQEIFEQMVEHSIFELMSIRSGQYEFETEDRPAPLPEDALTAEIGPILMEGARKADEVNEMRRFLGPEGGILVLTQPGRKPEAPEAHEAKVLGLVNGVRPIEAIVEESGLDTYAAMRALFGCARKGWITQLRQQAGTGAAEEESDTEFDLRLALRWGIPVGALVALALLVSADAGRYHAPDPLVGEWLRESDGLRTSEREREVQAAVEVFRVKRGNYPEALDALVDEGILPAGDLRAPGGGERWGYAVAPDGSAFALIPSPAPRQPAVD
jgi:hypothetical protein